MTTNILTERNVYEYNDIEEMFPEHTYILRKYNVDSVYISKEIFQFSEGGYSSPVCALITCKNGNSYFGLHYSVLETLDSYDINRSVNLAMLKAVNNMKNGITNRTV